MAADKTAGFRRETRGCSECGFGYMFELLDDYYPAPNAAFFAIDADGKVLDCGKGSFALTGLKTEQVIGQPVGDALGLKFEDGTDHVSTALEWEVRVQGKPVEVTAGAVAHSTKAVADLFPAYDDENGGLLIVLRPVNHH
jgi:hypothetical protein